MTPKADAVSLRLLRKGAFIEETYRLFAGWDFDRTLDANLDQAFAGHFRTVAWGAEVKATLRRRFRDSDEAAPLIVAAQRRLPPEEWRQCLHLWIGMRETLYHEFALNWLYPEYESGRYQLQAKDVQPFVRSLWTQVSGHGSSLSDYSVIRSARDLIRMATAFQLLNGAGPTKTFAAPHLSDRCFIYFAQVIAEAERSTARVPHSRLWRLVLMGPEDVTRTILRLHQYRKLEYQVAGSLEQLTLPCANAREYAEEMAA